ncbi:BCCT family transporter [Evansella cellulosilytica]|uniref:Choline/carnitine/betaine transporter n=1 Tax=Evansella cellulosilytica (strain ATCC 21833 / DSM 2522 / FERM P-1141 / JCM 9156 / N-4) TaxID=649639 RepID=E6U0I5_EVAC2|nr:BCCT family transporter [Evansella cellulosilytica]ADU31430.1 choline/carnitine/betaine transporter [Evansella cellulosilytica DSM 2522]
MNKIFKNIVLIISVIIVILISGWGFLFPSHMENTMTYILSFAIDGFGWFYVLSTAVFISFCLYLGFGPYKHMKLGKVNDKPEYSFFSWIGMLFAAGMGVGLVFWGVAEPMSHYHSPPPHGITPHSQEAAEVGILYGVFHWGIHPWAVYAIVALGLAFAKFRKELPGLISSAFYPIIGERIHGPIGKSIDIVAIIGTTIGIATSFGLSTLQISGGLNELIGIENSIFLQLSIVSVITVVFIVSVVTGINRGMKYLSITNLYIACFLLLAVLFLGPTLFILEHFTKTLGSYISGFIALTYSTTPYTDNEWIGNWTFFYWAWVISWSPFVGTFIARISRGRSLQQFIIGVLFIPTIVTVFWFVTFGGSGIFLEMNEDISMSEQIYSSPETGLFLVLSELPFGLILSLIALVLITIFFITSANSATYVLGVFTSQGNLSPKNVLLISWGILISAIASALIVSGGLDGLQAIAITTAVPFTLLMLFMIVAIYKSLRKEGIEKHRIKRKEDW